MIQKKIISDAMIDGAFGITLGLSANNIYPEECIEVLQAEKEYGGVFHNHMRSLFYTLRDAVRDTIMIVERSGVPGLCCHVYGRKYEGWGKSIEAMRQIQDARDRGVDVVADVYPWPFLACANVLFVSGGAYDERVRGRLEEGLSVEGMVQSLRESTSWGGMRRELMDSWEAENEENERRRRLRRSVACLSSSGSERPYHCWSTSSFTITISSMLGRPPLGLLLSYMGLMMDLKASQSMRGSILTSLSPSFWYLW